MGGGPSYRTGSTRGLTRSAEGQRTPQAAALAVSSERCAQYKEQRQRLVSQRLNIKIQMPT